MDQNAVFADPPEGGDINIVLMFYLALYPETFILSPNHPYPYPYEYEQVGDMSLLQKLLMTNSVAADVAAAVHHWPEHRPQNSQCGLEEPRRLHRGLLGGRHVGSV